MPYSKHESEPKLAQGGWVITAMEELGISSVPFWKLEKRRVYHQIFVYRNKNENTFHAFSAERWQVDDESLIDYRGCVYYLWFYPKDGRKIAKEINKNLK